MRIKALLIGKSISGIRISVLHSMFGLLPFNLSAESTGFVLSYVSIVSMLSQGINVGRITKIAFDEWNIIERRNICDMSCIFFS